MKTEIASNKVDCKTYLFCSLEETYHRVVAASPRFRENGGNPAFRALKQRAASDPDKAECCLFLA